MSEPKTPAELRSLLAEGSPGPWRFDSDPCDFDPEQEAPWLLGTRDKRYRLDPVVIGGSVEIKNPADRDLILALHNLGEKLAALWEAAEFKRNAILNDTAELKGAWVAVPAEDFAALRRALADLRGGGGK